MEEKIEEKKKEKVKYSPLQNTAFMLKTAWSTRKFALFQCLIIAALSVSASLLRLFISPVILQKVELAVPLSELIVTILIFTGLLMLVNALSAYFGNLMQSFTRLGIRMHIIKLIAHKTAHTSLPNRESTDFNEKLHRAETATANDSAATQGVWNTYTDIIKNIAGFAIYLLMLSGLDFYLMLIVIATTDAVSHKDNTA